MSFEIGEQRHYTVDAKLIPLGYQQITSLSTVKGLTVPPGARAALIQPTGQPVRWRDDGVDPTATIGMQILATLDILYTGDLAAIRFIETTGSAVLNISYYK
jgi:hypothetical protein